MFGLYHDFIINAPIGTVFETVSTPEGMNNWWTLRCSGKPALGESYNLYFSEEYDWNCTVTTFSLNNQIEFKMTNAKIEWLPTSFGFQLSKIDNNSTHISFYHINWKEISKEYRVANFCWANLLRQMKHYLEDGTITPFNQRN